MSKIYKTYRDESGEDIVFLKNSEGDIAASGDPQLTEIQALEMITSDDNNTNESVVHVSQITDFDAGVAASETTTSISFNTTTNMLQYTDEDAVVTNVDLSMYLDDTNLARLTSGVLNSTTGIATFTRDDSSTFDLDLSSLLDNQIASEVPFSPAGNTASNNVQDAIEELQSDIDNLASGAITDHGALTGLGDDDHTQYLTAARGDARYYTETELNAGQLDNRYYTETELDNGQLDNRYYTETELDGGQLDNRYYTETEIDALIASMEKVYWQASQSSVQNNINDTDVVLVCDETQNSKPAAFSFSSGILTIQKAGTFKFTVDVSADTQTGAREGLQARIQMDGGIGFEDILVGMNQAWSYHRNNRSGEGSLSIHSLITVSVGDQFRVVLNSPSQGVMTIPKGTNWIVEEK
jgi:uncharacterized protein YbcV (DUF1398 family)